MGWKRERSGTWPGRGPFSHLPPWQRPGWSYGRGACRWLLAPHPEATVPQVPPATVPPITVPPMVPALTDEQERQMLEQQMKALETQLDIIRKRLEELSK